MTRLPPVFYTGGMNGRKSRSSNDSSSKWNKTQYANLVRYVPSGAYYARFKVSGKIINRSLKADRVTIARQRLGDRIKEERKKAASAETRTRGRMTVG